MKHILSLSTLFFASTLALTSCGEANTNAKVKIKITSNAKEEIFIKPEDVVIKETLQTNESKEYYNLQTLPSTPESKELNILVIPVLIPGYDSIDLDGDPSTDEKEQVREDIEVAFFGDPDSNTTIGYESVSSFYNKSSYGKLDLKGTVTPWFDIKKELPDITNAASITIEKTYDVASKAIDWAFKTQELSRLNYDNDKDGYLDGVWLVYSANNYQNGGPRTDDGNYWAYTTWGNQTTPGDTRAPIYNLFGWASYDFMYENYENQIDAHTYIHETGHFLGLNDYYSDSMVYNPIGKVDMMDANIIDHNSYSKMLVGWTKPYIIRGNKEIEIDSILKENSFIIIPSDETVIENNEFDPFSEYILIELYEPKGLNEKDSLNKLGDSPLANKESGVRIYHIDNRRFYVDATIPNKIICEPYTGQKIDKTHRIITPITNNRNADQYNSYLHFPYENNLIDEIRLIENGTKDTFSYGGYQKNESLFHRGDRFELSESVIDRYFQHVKGKFNNGESFTSTIEIK